MQRQAGNQKISRGASKLKCVKIEQEKEVVRLTPAHPID
jgi:hypothetical protein